MMVRSATTTFAACSFSQDAAQSHSHPAVERDIRLRLLPTPPRGDAVTFSYERPNSSRRGLPPRIFTTFTGAHPGRPLAAFLFLGPTGVGKTESAKAAARVLFGDADRLIRSDLNEFNQP